MLHIQCLEALLGSTAIESLYADCARLNNSFMASMLAMSSVYNPISGETVDR